MAIIADISTLIIAINFRSRIVSLEVSKVSNISFGLDSHFRVIMLNKHSLGGGNS